MNEELRKFLTQRDHAYRQLAAFIIEHSVVCEEEGHQWRVMGPIVICKRCAMPKMEPSNPTGTSGDEAMHMDIRALIDAYEDLRAAHAGLVAMLRSLRQASEAIDDADEYGDISVAMRIEERLWNEWGIAAAVNREAQSE